MMMTCKKIARVRAISILIAYGEKGLPLAERGYSGTPGKNYGCGYSMMQCPHSTLKRAALAPERATGLKIAERISGYGYSGRRSSSI